MRSIPHADAPTARVLSLLLSADLWTHSGSVRRPLLILSSFSCETYRTGGGLLLSHEPLSAHAEQAEIRACASQLDLALDLLLGLSLYARLLSRCEDCRLSDFAFRAHCSAERTAFHRQAPIAFSAGESTAPVSSLEECLLRLLHDSLHQKITILKAESKEVCRLGRYRAQSQLSELTSRSRNKEPTGSAVYAELAEMRHRSLNIDSSVGDRRPSLSGRSISTSAGAGGPARSSSVRSGLATFGVAFWSPFG